MLIFVLWTALSPHPTPPLPLTPFLSLYCVSFIAMKKGWKITHHGSNDLTALSAAVVDNYHVTRVKVVSLNLTFLMVEQEYYLLLKEGSEVEWNRTNYHITLLTSLYL